MSETRQGEPGRWEQASARTLSQRPGEQRLRRGVRRHSDTLREGRIWGGTGPRRRRFRTAAGARLAVGRAGQREAGSAQRAGEASFEVAEALPWPSAQQRGLDAQREIAVRDAGLAQTPEGVSRAAQTVVDPGMPFAVAAPGGALGIERPADGFLGRVRLGVAVVAVAEQVVMLDQDLAAMPVRWVESARQHANGWSPIR